MTALSPPRWFAVDPAGVTVELVGIEALARHMGVSPQMSAAIDVLIDARECTDLRVDLLAARERRGDNPETFARHLVKLIKAAKTHAGTS